MPVPRRYTNASLDFARFLDDARDAAGLASSHQAYTMVQGVLRVFRRRITIEDAIRFAEVLPPLIRALFVEGWDTGEERPPFGSRVEMTHEAQALRAAHNFAPDTCIDDVAVALRRHVDVEALDALLATLPEGAVDFWRV